MLIGVGALVLSTQSVRTAQPPTVALPFEKGFLVTGGYAVGSVDLQQGSGSNGFLTGTINMSGVPANADILAAYLYWQTIATDKSQVKLPLFRDQKIAAAKETVKPLDPSIAPCYSGGSSNTTYTMYGFRADVLRLLPSKLDENGIRVLVNNDDLLANGQPLTTVRMPDAGSGNQSPTTAGVSLFVVYRDRVSPLTSISVYDGVAVQTPGAATEHTFAGFLGAPANANARMTQIVSAGANNSSERLYFNNTLLAANPFAGGGPASDRSWTTATYDVGASRVGGSLMGGKTDSAEYGEMVTTKIDHTSTSPYECLAWSAMIFSSTVSDIDADGLPDKLEDQSGLKSPDGKPLPDLHAMFATSQHKDLFIEIGAMTADGTETYGGQPGAAHNHLPTPDVLKMVGDSYGRAPVSNPDNTPGIRVHFDVGPNYIQTSGPYAIRPATADDPGNNPTDYLVPATFATGGESIKEVDCGVLDPDCQFKGYPGTVSWKIGFQVLRDAPVGPFGEEIFSETQLATCKATGNCRSRFDQERMNFFRYALFAHSRAKPKNSCINAADPEACKAGADYHTPSTASGIADLPGGDLMITLGGWGHGFVGSIFVQASTSMHELGHGSWLTHGGNSVSILEANCKPNYLSVMNYLFQMVGLRDEAGNAHLDYSTSTLGDALNENALPTGPTNPETLQYRTAFFAPILPGTLPALLGTPAAGRFCNGAPFPSNYPPDALPMGRVDLYSATLGSIDWSAGLNNGTTQQDVNFDGKLLASLAGFNDWAGLRLDQIGSRRNMGGFSLGIDLEFGVDVSGGEDLFGVDVSGGTGWDGVDYFGVDVSGGMDFTGDIDYSFGVDVSGGIDDLMFGVDVSGGGIDPFGVDVSGGQEMDRETARDLGNGPANKVKACVLDTPGCGTTASGLKHRVRITWKEPDVGTAASYSVYRVQGSNVTPLSTTTKVNNADVPGGQLSVVDQTELPNGVPFTYFVIVHFTDGANSVPSNFSTVTAVNDASVAVADSGTAFTVVTATTLNGAVFVNDTDTDTTQSSWTAVLIPGSGPLNAATNGFTFNANGTFTYKSKNGFTGTDTFQYRINAGTWPGPPSAAMSPNSGVVTVTITVTKKK